MRFIFGFICIFLWFSSTLFPVEDSVLKDAKKAFSRKAYQESVKKFTQYSETHPNDGVPFMYMGYIYEYKKDYPRSILNFRKAAELNLDKEQKKTVLLKLALFFNFHQDWNLAAVYSSRFLKYDPKNEEIGKIYNRAVGNRGNPGTAVTVSSIEKPAEARPSASSRKEENEKQEKPEKQEKSEKKEDLNDTAKQPASVYEKALQTNPNDEDLKWEYALALFEEKKWDKAESILSSLLEKDPNRSRYLYKLGMIKLRKDDPQGAIDNFEKAKKNPFSKDTNVFFYYLNLNQGLAYQKLKKTNEAEDSFKKSFQQVAKDPPLLALSRLKFQQSAWSDCAKFAEQAVSLGGQPEAHMFRFICSAEDGKGTEVWDSNFQQYYKFLEKNFPEPKSAPEKYHIGYLRLARQLTASGKPEKAETYFQIYANDKEVNQTREYLFYRGRNLFYLGKSDEALSLLQQVPNSSATYYLMARAYAKKGDFAKTKSLIQEAAKLKAEYWDFAIKESDFAEPRKDPGFLEFLKNKGQ